MHFSTFVHSQINILQQELVQEKELEKCKNKVLTYQHFSESSLLNRAISLAYYELIGDANLINTEEKKYEAIKAQDIQRFAQNTLNKNSSNTLFYLKKEV